MQDAKEEVRNRLNIEDVIGEYVQLRRAGRNWKGLSPFSSERTPSFVVSPDKQIWHDFSSNKGGDVFSFVMEVEGLDFRQTLELLARKAGVDMSLFAGQGSSDLSKKKQRLLSALSLAANYYQHSMIQNPRALEYVLKKRGLSRQVVQDFRIGYAPQAQSALANYLTKKGFDEHTIREAGLLGSRGARTDMFRGRMMVPLADGQGQIVGFTARLIDDIPNAPKYINTPQTLLYDKGRQVFGLHLAKEAIRKADYAVVVEGNLDVVSSHQAGVRQVVATAGTAMTENHLKSLSRLTNNIRLAFDSDAAGLAATERAVDIAQAVGVRLAIISLPDGLKDPDEAIQKDPAIWQKAIEQPVAALDWLIAQYAARFDPTSAEGKRQITTRALGVIAKLQDAVEQEHYLQMLSTTTGASMQAITRKLAEVGKAPPARTLKHAKVSGDVRPDRQAYQDSLLALTLTYPDTRPVLHKVDPASFSTDQRRAIASYLVTLKDQPLPASIPPELQSDETYVKILVLKAEERYGQWNSQDRYIEAAKLARDVISEQNRNQKDLLILQLRDAEDKADEKTAAALRSELNKLIKET
ncbi:MAG TPA: DNA primase [Candidatus Saccharimonadales bacterium]|jgi:DNA primase|nr:DNA primase [Candidatus Saccharimonadales bacterium]